MAAPNIPTTALRKVRKELNEKSESFCLAKWLQVTIHLQNGHTHSCHHPIAHKIPLDELEKDSSALHNTNQKKLARKEMTKGRRPTECEFCWNIEDANPKNLSDRTIKSAQPWAYPRMKEIKKVGWKKSVTPSYVEVSFGNDCNFRCAYCAPHISSSIMKELKEHGPYATGPTVEYLKESGLYPIPRNAKNPYVDAFWDWWPELKKDLKVFRITGGEPLLNANTFRFLKHIRKHPMPELTLAINSNLGVPPATFKKFLEEIKYLTQNGLVKEFQLFTSVDTHGGHAEFVRFGLNYQTFMENVRTYLEEVEECELIFMCAYNAISVLKFRNFLSDVTALKSKYFDSNGATRITLDMPYLKDPSYLSCYILTPDFLSYIRKDIEYMKKKAWTKKGQEIYYQSEIIKFERILLWLESLEENEHRDNTRREFSRFINEYQQRKKIKVEDYIPEYLPFINYCNQLLLRESSNEASEGQGTVGDI
jgi:organic radical activating enzyme